MALYYDQQCLISIPRQIAAHALRRARLNGRVACERTPWDNSYRLAPGIWICTRRA